MKKVFVLVLVLSLALSACSAFATIQGPLAKRDKGEDVRELQMLLINQGYLPGSADGIFGNMTEDTVRQFQLDNGLVATGIADQATIMLLYEKEAERMGGVPDGSAPVGPPPQP